MGGRTRKRYLRCKAEEVVYMEGFGRTGAQRRRRRCVNVVATMPMVRGRLTPNAALAPLVWFKSGGNAEWLFEPGDEADLVQFLRELDPDVPVMALGLGSNLIV